MEEHYTDMSLLNELRELRQEVKELKANRPTKEEILAIKDTHRRLKAIEENMDLFADCLPKRG